MTVKEKKVVIALRRYYRYLTARLYYIAIGIITPGPREFKRLITTRGIYNQAFEDNPGFKHWLLKKTHICRKKKARSQMGSAFFVIADRLKNEILESEK